MSSGAVVHYSDVLSSIMEQRRVKWKVMRLLKCWLPGPAEQDGNIYTSFHHNSSFNWTVHFSQANLQLYLQPYICLFISLCKIAVVCIWHHILLHSSHFALVTLNTQSYLINYFPLLFFVCITNLSIPCKEENYVPYYNG